VSRTGRRRTKRNGKDLRPAPLNERKAKLARLLAGSAAGIVFNEPTDRDGAVRYPGRAGSPALKGE
jgi:ATP-dependent DNA ligase